MLQYDTPYSYCGSNPISFTDPTGMVAQSKSSPFVIASTFVDDDGQIIEYRNDGDPRIYSVSDVDAWRKGGSKKSDAKFTGKYELAWVFYGDYVGKNINEAGSAFSLYAAGQLDMQPLESSFVDDVIEVVFTAGGYILIKRCGKWIFKKFTKEVAEEFAELTAKSVDDKLVRYLLNFDHAVGKSKAKWFKEALGFTTENMSGLLKQIVFDKKSAVLTNVTEFGTKYAQKINITGANGRKISVQFNWITNNDGVTRLIGAIPTKK
jgi:hypothetical protein